MSGKTVVRYACRTGKRCYRTRLDAEIALSLRLGRKDHRREKNEKRCYRCPFCQRWHLTSQR